MEIRPGFVVRLPEVLEARERYAKAAFRVQVRGWSVSSEDGQIQGSHKKQVGRSATDNGPGTGAKVQAPSPC